MAQVFDGLLNLAGFSRQSTTTPKLIKTGGGVLTGITVNTPATNPSTLTVYDGVDATGSVIATINLYSVMQINPGTLGFIYAAAPGWTLTYGLYFQSGLYVTMVGSVADVTVSFI